MKASLAHRRVIGSTWRIALLFAFLVGLLTPPMTSAQAAGEYIVVRANEDSVEAFNWPVGTDVTLTVDSTEYGPETVLSDTPWGSGETYALFDLEPDAIQPHMTVSVSDGITSKTLDEVSILEITAYDLTANTFSGIAEPGAQLYVNVCDDSGCVGHDTTADGSGNWLYDFTGEWDIGHHQWLDSHKTDDDGDETAFGVSTPNPTLAARMQHDEVHGYGWPLGAEIDLTIDDPTNGISVDFTASETAVEAPWDSSEVWVQFKLWEGDSWTLAAGQVITMTDGTITKEHTVSALAVTTIDPDLDTIAGTVEADTLVEVDGNCGDEGCEAFRRETADGAGDWLADFSVVGEDEDEQSTADIDLGSSGEARAYDDDGDFTRVPWHVYNPRLGISANDDLVAAIDWPMGSDLTLEIDDPGTAANPDYTDTMVVTEYTAWGWPYCEFHTGDFDVEVDFWVSVTDGLTPKTHLVRPVQIWGHDLALDTVWGTSTPGARLHMNACDDGDCAQHELFSDPTTGAWIADFADPLAGPTWDIVAGNWLDAHEMEDDGSSTGFGFWVPNPWISVRVNENSIQAIGWPMGAELVLAVDDPAVGTEVDYTDTQTVVDYTPWGSGETFVQFAMDGFEVESSFEVTVTDGEIPKTLVVSDLQITDYDMVLSSVSGVGTAGEYVGATMDTDLGHAQRHLTADSITGAWTADFANPGPGDDEQDTLQIVPGAWLDSHDPDEDGDETASGITVGDPYFEASAKNQWVRAVGWSMGASLTLEIDDPETPTYPDFIEAHDVTEAAPWDEGLPYLEFVLGTFDLEPGFLVTVTGESIVKTHTVTDLRITGYDLALNTVEGHTTPGASVLVHACGDYGCPDGISVEADETTGDWTADLNPSDLAPGDWLGSHEYDGDGDGTAYDFDVPGPADILLVDDDNNSPDIRSYYTDALDALGVSYAIWDTDNSDAEPQAADLTNYGAAIWFTGAERAGYAGPGASGEAALGSYLDGGGCFLISSQDYHHDKGPTSFMQTYLGVDHIIDDDSPDIVLGAGSVFGGLGPYTQSYAFPDQGDQVHPDGTAELAFTAEGIAAGVDKTGSGYLSAFLGFPIEAMVSTDGQRAVLEAFLGACGGILPASIDGTVTDLGGEPIDGVSFRVRAMPPSWAEVYSEACSDPSTGDYTLAGIPAGEVLVFVQGDRTSCGNDSSFYGFDFYDSAGDVNRPRDSTEITVASGADIGSIDLYLGEAVPYVEYLIFNLDNPQLTKTVRQAIAHGTNRQAIMDAAWLPHDLYGTVLDSYVPDNHWAVAPGPSLHVYQFDADQARAMLDAEGWILNPATGIREKGGEALTLEYKTTTAAYRVDSGVAFVEQMAAIGIDVVPEYLASLTGATGPLQTGAFDLVEMGLAECGHTMDETCVPFEMFYTGGAENYSNYSSVAADAEYDAAQIAPTHESRLGHAIAHQVIVMEDLPQLPLFTRVEPLTISGDAGVANAQLNFANGSTQNVTAASDGSYSITTPMGWSGTVTPKARGFSFTPSSMSYTKQVVDRSAQDYTAKPDVIVYSGGAWLQHDFATGTYTGGVWTGNPGGCIPSPMDYDGDGGLEFTQLCGPVWHFYNDDGSYNKGVWTGLASAVPVPADYNGDGIDDPVVFDGGAWQHYSFATGLYDAAHSVWTGLPGGAGRPAPVDYDGDGAADPTILAASGAWHFYNDNGSYHKGIWIGMAGAVPVPGDYNGDGTEQPVAFVGGAWQFFDFATGLYDAGTSAWTGAPAPSGGGLPNPTPLDYDGDGTLDFTYYAGGAWHFYDDSGSYLKGIWTGGAAGDLPISRRQLP